jgi:hypothetical protein
MHLNKTLLRISNNTLVQMSYLPWGKELNFNHLWLIENKNAPVLIVSKARSVPQRVIELKRKEGSLPPTCPRLGSYTEVLRRN